MRGSQRLKRPVWLPPGVPVEFPDPSDYDDQGLVAVGADLRPERLLSAYHAGIFPWFDEPPILWWSPNPRAVLDPEHLHISRSLRRHLRGAARSGELTVRATAEIEEVMRTCGQLRESSWINDEMLSAYVELGRLGKALAYEVRRGAELVGGLYGVLSGGLFAAESMFHIETDASKAALVTSVLHRFALGTRLYDVQFETGHLRSMGAYEINRSEYLTRLSQALSGSPPANPAGALTSETGPEAQEISSLGTDLLPWVVRKLEVL